MGISLSLGTTGVCRFYKMVSRRLYRGVYGSSSRGTPISSVCALVRFSTLKDC